MELGSVRALKDELSANIVEPLVRENVRARRFGIPASSIELAERPPRAVALGVAAGEKHGDYSLAVRIQRRALFEDDRLIATLRDRARGETDIRYIGQVTKQTPWHQSRQRPMKLGASIAHYRVTAGTIGGFARCRETDKLCVLSNNHVLANENRCSAGDAILQAGPYDGGRDPGDRVGALFRWVNLNVAANEVDAAIGEIEAEPDLDCGLLQGLGSLGGVGVTPLLPGMSVAKIGRTTGLTRGIVTAVELDDVVVGYDEGNFSFNRQIEIEGQGDKAFSAGGDSGSLIVNDQMEAVGLLFAGGDTGGSNDKGLTYANAIENVLSALKIDLVF